MASTDRRELFTFTRSDGGGNRSFPTDSTTDEKGHVNYYRVVDEDEEQKWLTSVGTAIASQTGKPPGPRYTLKSFPQGYTMYIHLKGPASRPRRDRYLIGSQHIRAFRSPAEFAPHALWLMEDPTMDRSNCHCKYCSKRSQTVVSRVLGISTASRSRLTQYIKKRPRRVQKHVGVRAGSVDAEQDSTSSCAETAVRAPSVPPPAHPAPDPVDVQPFHDKSSSPDYPMAVISESKTTPSCSDLLPFLPSSMFDPPPPLLPSLPSIGSWWNAFQPTMLPPFSSFGCPPFFTPLESPSQMFNPMPNPFAMSPFSMGYNWNYVNPWYPMNPTTWSPPSMWNTLQAPPLDYPAYYNHWQNFNMPLQTVGRANDWPSLGPIPSSSSPSHRASLTERPHHAEGSEDHRSFLDILAEVDMARIVDGASAFADAQLIPK